MKALIFLCLAFCACLLSAQRHKFDHLTLEDGLVGNAVFSMHIDQKGFMWIGTCNGLVKYDGKGFETIQLIAAADYDLAGACIYHIQENEAGNLWLATYDGLFYFDIYKNELSHVPHLKERKVGIENTVWFAHEDKFGQVWMIDNNDELLRLDLDKKETTYFHQDAAAYPFLDQNKVSILKIALGVYPAFHEAKNGDIWLGTVDKGLLIFRQGTKTFEPLNRTTDPSEYGNVPGVLSIFEDKQQRIWVGTAKGIHQWDTRKETFLNLNGIHRNALISDSTWVNLEDEKGDLWIACKGGIGKLNPGSGSVEYFPFSNESNYVVPVYEGSDGSIWVLEWQTADNRATLHEFDRLNKKYIPYISDREKEHTVFSGIGFSQYLVDNTNVFWMGSFREGVNKLDVSSRKFYPYRPEKNEVFTFQSPEGLPELQIFKDKQGILWQIKGQELLWIRQYVTDEKGNIWIINNQQPFITKGLGITKLEPNKGTYTVFFDGNDLAHVTCGNTANVLLADRWGNIWIGFWDYFTAAPAGLVKYDPDTDSFNCYQPNPLSTNSLEHEAITDLYEDENGNIWIALIGVKGEVALQKLNPLTEEFTSYKSFKSTVWEIEGSTDGMLWLGTILQGLFKFDPSTGQVVKQYRQSDGLANSSVQDIEIDQTGNLWLRTEFGLSKFNPQAETFENFTVEDGLLSNRANGTQLAFQSSSCDIYLATPSQNETTNLVYFSPEKLKNNPYPPELAFTDFKISNKNVEIGKDSPLPQHISTLDEIHLSYQQNDISLSFSALHFNRPEENNYAYKLEPTDQEWRKIGTQNTIILSNMVAGNYTLKVKASNYDGVWNEEGISLNIYISPPWWRTWWAYVIYAMSIFSVLFTVYRYRLKQQLRKAEAKRLQEVDTLKTQLYTNITHEFRTPLTVIQGMAAEIEKKPKEARKLITSNSQHLLRLITQLLDMSKIEAGKMELHLGQDNVIDFIAYLTQSFSSFAAMKESKVSFFSEESEIIMEYDAEKLQNSIGNLLSNAIKFSPKGSQVRVEVTHKTKADPNRQLPLLQIKVTDNGIGISQEELPHVFDRFYQADNTYTRKGEGTGIGLTLTKQLITLMGGTIEVKSKLGVGTEFLITLPILKTSKDNSPIQLQADFIAENKNRPISPELDAKNEHVTATSLPLLLIIEDNPDIIVYIKICLQEFYTIKVAYDGKQGIESALELIPDVIISDVMMPEKDGYEVTRRLKNDERTSHVPIILLTAKADVASKIEGLQRGADAYLTKPFHKEELLIRIRKLIELRKKMQARYSTTSTLLPTEELDLQVEDAFITKMKSIIEARLRDSQFSVTTLCEEAGMSQSQLYRKVKALTNLTLVAFIRNYRLQKAKELLDTTALNISEIAYQAGFSDPTYFSRTFSEKFGLSPSDYKNSILG